MTYLDAAYRVLSETARPLSAVQIIAAARSLGLVLGQAKNPESIMRARLYEDLRNKAHESRFQYSGNGRFALREWEMPEHYPKPFIKSVPEEILVALPAELTHFMTEKFGYTELDIPGFIETISANSRLSFESRPLVELDESKRQLISYVILRDSSNRYLSYRRGKYSAAHSMLTGARCLGFGGHVQADDALDLFGYSNAGLTVAAEREMQEELPNVAYSRLRSIGIINDYSSPEGMKHIGVVYLADLEGDTESAFQGGERAVSDIRLMSRQELARSYHQFEFWSQLVIRHVIRIPKKEWSHAVIRPQKRIVATRAIVVVGEIASGKTTFVEMLRDAFGFDVVSTRSVVSRLIGLPDFGFSVREDFQTAAASLVKTQEGVQRLVVALVEDALVRQGPVVIDGVRNMATLAGLREQLDSLTVVYIETSRDLAFRNYKKRANRAVTIDEFRNARYHPVEAEVASLKLEADVYLWNGGTPDDLFSVFKNWWD